MSDTPMIDLLLGDLSYWHSGAPKLRVTQWSSDHSAFATLDLTALAKEVGDVRAALAEARAERDRMERGIEAALNENEATRVLLFRNEELKRDADTLRTQLAAARGELVAALATMQKIGAQKNAWIKRATDAEKRILSLLTAALTEATP